LIDWWRREKLKLAVINPKMTTNLKRLKSFLKNKAKRSPTVKKNIDA